MKTTAQVLCRLCSRDLSGLKPYLLPNAPAGAQWLPGNKEIKRDKPATLKIYQCPACRLVQLAVGAPVLYCEGITSVTSSSARMMAHRRSQAQEFVSKFHLRGKKILEVGCGDGHFLKILKELGAKAVGIEPSRKAKSIGEGSGVRILEGAVDAGRSVEGAPYDAFVTFHVMEHVPDPNHFLQGLSASLQEGGYGLIEVPSVEQILEKRRCYDFQTDHLSYFGKKTLGYLLSRNGFEALKIFRNWQGEHLVAYVKKVVTTQVRHPRPSTPLRINSGGNDARNGIAIPEQLQKVSSSNGDLSWLRSSVEGLRRDLKNFIQRHAHQKKKVAVWGASHHSLAVLAMTGVSGIEYVVDSSEAKQGRFTPVSHLPIVSPEALKRKPVGGVVIIAPRYDKEILAQLRRDCGFRGTVAVLNEDKLRIVP